LPQYASPEMAPRNQHPMVDDTLDTVKSVEMDLNEQENGWRSRRDNLQRTMEAHLASADLIRSAINRVDFLLHEDRAEVAKDMRG
jgi:hypothetical protein